MFICKGGIHRNLGNNKEMLMIFGTTHKNNAESKIICQKRILCFIKIAFIGATFKIKCAVVDILHNR